MASVVYCNPLLLRRQETRQMSSHTANKVPDDSAGVDKVLAEVRQWLDTIQYGAIEIMIHDGRVVQLEKREKKRY